MAEPAVRTEGLTRFYGKRRGIVGIDLEVREGEMVGLIGPEGAGKTTTLLLIINFMFPTYGTAEIFGLDSVRDSREIKEYVGYVPAEAAGYRGMRPRELLQWSAAIHGVDDLTRAWAMAERVDLDVERRLDGTASPDCRKTAFVLALLHEPGLLALDEPLRDLEPVDRARVSDILKEENAKGVTVLLTGGSLADAAYLCTRAAILWNGRLAATEDASALRGKQLRLVSVRSDRKLEPSDFPSGTATSFSMDEGRQRFLYAGDGNLLVRELAALDAGGLLVEEPPPEEVFRHFYGKEGRQ